MPKDIQYFTEPVPKSNDYIAATAKQLHAALSTAKKITDIKAEIAAQTKALANIQKSCKHTVWFDEPTFMFTYRTCAACFKIIEEI